jgi:hypothetical protein
MTATAQALERVAALLTDTPQPASYYAKGAGVTHCHVYALLWRLARGGLAESIEVAQPIARGAPIFLLWRKAGCAPIHPKPDDDGLADDHRIILRALAKGSLDTAALRAATGLTRDHLRQRTGELIKRRLITATRTPSKRGGTVLVWSLRQELAPAASPLAVATPTPAPPVVVAPPAPIEPPRSPSVHQVPPLHASPALAMRERIAAAKRRAADRAAVTVEAGGLRWTVRPVTEIKGAWEIVESVSPDDRRLFGEDVARRRLARLASEGRLPARTDGLTPSQKEPRP